MKYLQKLSMLLSIAILPTIAMAKTPDKPSELSLIPAKNSVTIGWRDNSDNESGFKILRDGELIHTTKENIQSYIDRGLTPNTTYKYTIIATNDDPDIINNSGVVINEVLAGNIDIKLDPDFYQFSDYIELHNTKSRSVDIGGFYLSDDSKKPKKYKIPSNTNIPANGYILIWADKESVKKSALHANFSLSLKKERVTLSDRSGSVVDEINYKKLKSNISAKVKDGEVVYMNPTPNMPNSTIFVKSSLLKKPTFSKDSGFYQGDVTVALSQEDGAKIYYSLDGSAPTKESKIYKAPIKLSKTTTLRAKSIKDGKLPSVVETKSYIINHKSFQNTLPVISVSVDPKYLFDDYIGIYVKGKNGVPLYQCSSHASEPVNYAQDWDRPVNIEYFDKSRESKFSFGSDISITGQCSRKVGQRSFKIELDKKYGQKSLKYKLFKDKDIKKFKDFKLRVDYEGYYILDMLAAALVKDGKMNVDYQAYQTAQMYVNGEYWGLYNIRESKGGDYLESNYPNINKDIIDVINRGTRVKRGDMIAYKKLKDFVKEHDLSNSNNYQEISKMVDIDSFMDYMIIMIYSGNSDWIWNNHRCWRERKEGAKWRWMLDDLDVSFRYESNEKNYFDVATGSGPVLTKLLRGLLKNREFKNEFVSRFNRYLDTTLSSSNVKRIANELIDTRREYMDLKGRWYINRDRFDNYTEGELMDFIDRRVGVLRDQMRDRF